MRPRARACARACRDALAAVARGGARGEALASARAGAKLVRTRECRLRDGCALAVLAALPLRTAHAERAERKSARRGARALAEAKAGGAKSRRSSSAARGRRRRARRSGEERRRARMREGGADAVAPGEFAKHQRATLHEALLVYFRVIKSAAEDGGAADDDALARVRSAPRAARRARGRGRRGRAAARPAPAVDKAHRTALPRAPGARRLLPAALRGLSRVAHLINVDVAVDLLAARLRARSRGTSSRTRPRARRGGGGGGATLSDSGALHGARARMLGGAGRERRRR